MPEQPDGSHKKHASKLDAQGDVQTSPPGADAAPLPARTGRRGKCVEARDCGALDDAAMYCGIALKIGDTKKLAAHGLDS